MRWILLLLPLLQEGPQATLASSDRRLDDKARQAALRKYTETACRNLADWACSQLLRKGETAWRLRHDLLKIGSKTVAGRVEGPETGRTPTASRRSLKSRSRIS